jgi:hypothetical protein
MTQGWPFEVRSAFKVSLWRQEALKGAKGLFSYRHRLAQGLVPNLPGQRSTGHDVHRTPQLFFQEQPQSHQIKQGGAGGEIHQQVHIAGGAWLLAG